MNTIKFKGKNTIFLNAIEYKGYMARVEVWVIEDINCSRNLHSRNNIKLHIIKYGDEIK